MPFDPMTGEYFVGTLAAHRAATAAVGNLFFHAARPDVLAATVNQYMTLLAIQEGTTGVTMASGGTLIGTGAGGALLAGGLPVITMVGAWVALGSGYYEAREQAKSENSKSGFSQGFVMGVLEWTWDQAASRFGRRHLRINAFDEEMDRIRVLSYNGALKTGFAIGRAMPADAKKAYRIKLRKLAGHRGSGAWSRDADEARNQQISYVIELAAAGLINGLIRPE